MNLQEQRDSPQLDCLKRVQLQLDYLKDASKRRLSDYVKLNTGRVASKNALGLGALVGASVLMELFLSGTAHATYCAHSQWYDGSLSRCYHVCSSAPPPTMEEPCAVGLCPASWDHSSDPDGCPLN